MTAVAERTRARRLVGAATVEALRRAGPFPFARTFVRHLVPSGPSPLHRALNTWHADEANGRDPGRKDAVGAPRGHGKSTAGVEVAALYHAAYCTRRFQVIASATYEQAVERLATIITETENNEELRAAFPNLRPAVDRRGMFVSWRDDDVIFACGCRIKAVGAGKSIRGLRRGAQRPDLVYFDDLEDEDSVATDAQIAKRLRWILRVALGLAGPTKGISALWVGTILSRRALLNQATGAALDEGQHRPEWAQAWTPHVFRAEVEGTPKVPTQVRNPETGELVVGADGKPLTYDIGVPMWSAMTRELLASIRWVLGALAYAAEYLSDPADEATAILARPISVGYVNPNAPPLARIIRLPDGRLVAVASMVRAAALDPQYATPSATSDPDLAAIMVAGQYGADTFLLEVWIDRDRHGQASRLVNLGVKWSCFAVGVEKTAAQVVTADAAAADGRLPVVAMPPVGGKVERALPLAVRLGDKAVPESCRVYVLPEAEAVVEYIERFPHGRYKDPVDATVYAVELAARGAGVSAASSSPPQLGGSR